jgi:hypothetical protein
VRGGVRRLDQRDGIWGEIKLGRHFKGTTGNGRSPRVGAGMRETPGVQELGGAKLEEAGSEWGGAFVRWCWSVGGSGLGKPRQDLG